MHNDHRILRDFLARFDREARILDLGCGNRRLAGGILNCDLVPWPCVDVVADARQLPFPDRFFDGIVLQEVLEHVLEPQQVLAEAARILKPSGQIYVETPFLYPIHAKADYYRWTLEGIEHLVGQYLRRIESGLAMGPASALGLSWRAFYEAKLAGAHWSVRNLIGWFTSWIKLIDSDRIRDQRPTSYAAAFVIAGPKGEGSEDWYARPHA